MRNQDCWDFANRHSIRLMWKISLLTCVIQAIGVILLDEGVALLTATIVLVTTLIYSVYLTEKALKNTFDKEGKDYENHLYWKNYSEHTRELGNETPKEPVFFLKPDSAISPKGYPFFIPDFSNNVQYEVELVIRINRLENILKKSCT